MRYRRKKRVLVLAGAGASLEFGGPTTDALTNSVEEDVLSDDGMRSVGGDRAWAEIRQTLSRYLNDGIGATHPGDAVNFEEIYHCAHELLSTFEPTKGAVKEFRPILVPFVRRRTNLKRDTLKALVSRIGEIIFHKLVAVSDKPTRSLSPLNRFLEKLREDYVTRIYTTNYDDLLLQAGDDFYTGFDPARSSGAKILDRRSFWSATDRDCIFHLHGSVHLAFGLTHAGDANPSDLYWYDDRTEALANSSYSGSDDRRMDRGGTVRTVVITGLDKLSPLQRQPFSHYYASIARDAMAADVIYIIGCGLADLHLNTWLGEARRREPQPPLIFVDCWRPSFLGALASGLGRKEIEMIHALRMRFAERGCTKHGTGWVLDNERTYAVWDKGFLGFLNAPGELDDILEELV